jgi:DNA-binding LacI/PurR family transcriptional regulator
MGGGDLQHSYLKVKERLYLTIKSLSPGAKLKSRPELSRQFHTSRTTIDRAISELIGEGYLCAKDGSGTYVTEEAFHKYQAQKAMYRNWGVILPDITKDTYPGIMRGIEDEASRDNYNVIICNSDDSEKKQTTYLRNLIHTRVAGIIIVPAILSARETVESFEEVARSGIPIVFCNRGFPFFDAPKVLSNNFYGSYIAVKHLLAMGYRKIAFITKQWYSSAQERFGGYMAALTEANLVPKETYYVFSPEGNISPSAAIPDETPLIERLMLSDDPPDAAFCFNDSVAERVFWEVIKLGKRPGINFGITGYDDTGICERLPVKLSSVKYKTYEIGMEAAKLLKSIIGGEKVSLAKTVILQPELIVRESSRKIETAGERDAENVPEKT